jgi:hypothetical protein
MPSVEFESTIPMFKEAKTVHSLDRTATVIGSDTIQFSLKFGTVPWYITELFYTLQSNVREVGILHIT